MIGMNKHKFEIIRTLTAALVIVAFTLLPASGIAYGTTSAFTLDRFTFLSPLEWLLVMLGTKMILAKVLVPGLIVVLTIVLFGRFLCGWVCPVGILLDSSHNISMTANKRNQRIPGNSTIRYSILLAVLASSIIFNFSLPYLFSPPGIVYRTMISYTMRGIVGVDVVVLLIILVLDILSLRYGRTWCNSICPLGTTISSLSIVNLLRPRIDQKKCINCLDCERVCPMQIPLTTRTDNWAMMTCNKCLKCLDRCPTGAVKISAL
jgi:ferredoxin-type protein NapH